MAKIIEITDFAAPELDVYARLSESQLFPTQDISFCGHVVRGPHDPVGILKTVYGDTYMELPPVEDRMTHALYMSTKKEF